MKSKYFVLLLFVSLHVTAQNRQAVQEKIEREINEVELLATSKPTQCIEKLEALKKSAEDVGYAEGTMNCYRLLMVIFYNQTMYSDVIKQATEAEELIFDHKNYKLLSDTYRLKGISLIELKLNNEGEKELKKALAALQKIPESNSKNYRYSLIYDNIGGYYNNKKRLDKVVEFKNKSLLYANKMNDSARTISVKYKMVAFQNMNLGIVYAQLKKNDVAKDFFLKALKIHNDSRYQIDKGDEIALYYEIANFYHNTKDFKKARSFSDATLSKERSFSLPQLRRDAYELLSRTYLAEMKPDSSLVFSNLYLKIDDSIKKEEKNMIDNSVKLIFDKKEETHRYNIAKILLAALIVCIVLLILFWLFYKKKKAGLQKKYNALIEDIERTDKDTDNNKALVGKVCIVDTDLDDGESKSNGISENMTGYIVSELEQFERSQDYLKKEISLAYLASAFNVNSKYLSQTIRDYRNKPNFNAYINNLRIQHIIHVLNSDEKFRKYKISYISEYCGYSSREIFVAAFKRETGIPPSYFIENLNKADIKGQ